MDVEEVSTFRTDVQPLSLACHCAKLIAGDRLL